MSETNNKGVKVLASASLLFVTIIWGSAFVVMKNSWNGGSFLETDPGNVDAGV